MSQLKKIVVISFLSLIPCLVVGCGGEKNPGTVPVSVKITQKGSPLSDATVSIISKDGKSASGRTNASGIAELSTVEGWDGAFPGEYGVSVEKTEMEIVKAPSADSPNGTRAQRKNLLPKKYASSKTSGFTMTVDKGQKEPVVFDITE